MATITYRALDANGDPMMGAGQANFVSDLQAVAQSILTALRLFQGEWWENRNAGTPVFQSMLATTTGMRPEAVALLLKQRILSRPYVLSVDVLEASFDTATRAFTFAAQVQTAFGPLTLTNS